MRGTKRQGWFPFPACGLVEKKVKSAFIEIMTRWRQMSNDKRLAGTIFAAVLAAVAAVRMFLR